MHLLLTDRGAESFLIHELRRAFPRNEHCVRRPGVLETDFTLQLEALPLLVFARQFLPGVERHYGPSISAWAQLLFSACADLPEHQPWQVHIVPQYGGHLAGEHRCRLIYQALQQLLQRKRRHLRRMLDKMPAPFGPEHSVVQLLLTSPGEGVLSVARAPAPFALRRLLWPVPGGDWPVASDKAAPSRAFAKLLEAEARLGESIRAGESCVDLGASPGSWSYVALGRGAAVVAVDRAPLRADLMSHPHLVFRKGDAFTFEPQRPVDWLLCDVIAAPQRTVDLLLRWVRGQRARRFVVTLKFKGSEDYPLLEHVKHALPPLCEEFYLTRLCANKNEVCAFGTVRMA